MVNVTSNHLKCSSTIVTLKRSESASRVVIELNLFVEKKRNNLKIDNKKKFTTEIECLVSEHPLQ